MDDMERRLKELEDRTPRLRPRVGAARPEPQGVGLPLRGTAGRFLPLNPSAATTSVLTQGVAIYMPFQVPAALNIDQLIAEITTAGAATCVLRLGLYLDDGTGNHPGALLIDAGTVAADSTGVKTAAAVVTLPAGRLWATAVAQVTGTPTARTASSSNIVVPLPGSVAVNTLFPFATGVTGALPATATAASSSAQFAVQMLARLA